MFFFRLSLRQSRAGRSGSRSTPTGANPKSQRTQHTRPLRKREADSKILYCVCSYNLCCQDVHVVITSDYIITSGMEIYKVYDLVLCFSWMQFSYGWFAHAIFKDGKGANKLKKISLLNKNNSCSFQTRQTQLNNIIA